MKNSEKLRLKIKEDLGFDVEIPVRVRRGRHGKSGGTWAWMARRIGCAGDVGSEDTMAECLSSGKLGSYSEIRTGGDILVCAGGGEKKLANVVGGCYIGPVKKEFRAIYRPRHRSADK